VVQIKTKETDGYEAVQLGFGEKRYPNKPEIGLGNKANFTGRAFRFLREFPVDSGDEYVLGMDITVEIFSRGDLLSVTGTSKGRGFAGVMKRHGFGGGRATHGCLTPRSPGSIGSAADPSRVLPGKKMAGHYGAARVTIKNLRIVDIRPEYHAILVRGSIPGPVGGLLFLKKIISPTRV
jgi:large subunit ribosomal protein L3